MASLLGGINYDADRVRMHVEGALRLLEVKPLIITHSGFVAAVVGCGGDLQMWAEPALGIRILRLALVRQRGPQREAAAAAFGQLFRGANLGIVYPHSFHQPECQRVSVSFAGNLLGCR